MQSIYTAGASSYSMSNLYKPAGVVNINASYNAYNGATYVDNKGNTNYTNGEMISKPTITNTSAILGLTSVVPTGFDQITNTTFYAQHLDYEQNANNFSGFNPTVAEFIHPIVYDSLAPNLIIVNTQPRAPPRSAPVPHSLFSSFINSPPVIPVQLNIVVIFRLQPDDKNTYKYFTVIATNENNDITTTISNTSPATLSLLSEQTYIITVKATDNNDKVSVDSNSITITI